MAAALRGPTKLFLAFLVLAALAVAGFALAIEPPRPAEAPLALGFGAAMVVAALFPLSFGPKRQLVFDTAILSGAVLLFTPGTAIAVVALGQAAASLIQRRERLEATFNAAQFAVQAAAGAWIAASLGWNAESTPLAWPAALVVVLATGGVMHVVNTGTVALIVALQERQPFLPVWSSTALGMTRAEVLAHLAQLGLGLLAVVVALADPWALLLLLLPAAAVWVALGHHVRLRLRAEEQLIHQAFHDPLTDLPNRAMFLSRLEQSLTVDRRDGGFALLFLDLDNFKLVNDTLGHAAGDRLLVDVARRLRTCVRPGDMVARLGGDEFTVLVNQPLEDDGFRSIAERIVEAVTLPVQLDGREVVVTASVGIVQAAAPHASAVDLLRDADVALYQAKATGRARVVVYDARMGDAAQERAALEGDLRHALDRGELSVHFQPQVELATGRIVGVEALLGWTHPQRGVVEPADFLPVAEETGLILPIGRWILATACAQARAWQDRFADPPKLSVNLSTRQLLDVCLVDDVVRVLQTTGLAPANLKLDITPAVTITDPHGAAEALAELHRLGLQVAIDNVGVQSFSLGLLGRFPLDVLKLDKTLVAELGQNAQAEVVAGALVGVARALSLTVLAVGVERPDQIAMLRDLGCTAAQGRLFSAPCTGDEMTELLSIGMPSVHRRTAHPPEEVPALARRAPAFGPNGLAVVAVIEAVEDRLTAIGSARRPA
jgi:diguanylate cyclase (GGDEF)-like protein